MNTSRPNVVLKKGEGRTIKSGGLWIYDNEISKCPDNIENGSIVDVLDFDGYFLGTGFINMNSKIRIRLLCRRTKDIDILELLKLRLINAWNYRKYSVDISSCRIVFGEADYIPGMVIDKFSDILVVQSLALGIDKYKNYILDTLKDILAKDGIIIRGIYERSDAKVRELEGMERVKGFIGEEFDTDIEIEENGIKYIVDIKEGQKTGFFLDQKYNRLAIQRYCKDAEVLDCFTHTGSFSLNAAKGGAKHVIGVDISELGCNQARINAKLNGYENIIDFECQDVFEFLPQLLQEGKLFDVVILDPPAFTKSRSSIKNATKGYKEINLRGMKLVKPGGFFATCSCSHFMDSILFEQTILSAAKDAHKILRRIEYRYQSPDHPILCNNDESNYLKFYIYQVCEEL